MVTSRLLVGPTTGAVVGSAVHLDAGVTYGLYCEGMASGDSVDVEASNADDGVFEDLYFNTIKQNFSYQSQNVVRLVGPLVIRINKPVTTGTVSVHLING